MKLRHFKCKFCNMNFRGYEYSHKTRVTCSKKCQYALQGATRHPSKSSLEALLRSNHARKGKVGNRLGSTVKLVIRRKISKSHLARREQNHLWKGGITPLNKAIRHSLDYKLWREAVFARDNWTCIECGQRGGELNADHIKPFAYFPELRFAIDNGRTLCVPCHSKTDTYRKRIYAN